MTRGGYVGRFLNVDLTRGELRDEIPDERMLRDFVGGYGVGARLLYERMPRGADPMGSDNILGFVTGPLTGTPALMGSRYCVVGKSPLTGGWGDANSGGYFGPALKFAGYDAVFIRGSAQEPAHLLIEDGHAELRRADHLWGLDSVETEEALQARHGRDTRVACIGPAGERLCLNAAIMNDQARAAGRSGLGAVMGSKRLKPVAVRGSDRPKVARRTCVQELRARYLPKFNEGAAEVLHKYGISGFTESLLSVGRTPIKNWRGTYPDDFPDAEAIDGPALTPYEQRKYACWRCPQACGAIMKWTWTGQTQTGHRPEHETLALMGSNCGIDDPVAIMTLNDICNRQGLDTISAGAAIAFAMEGYEHGLLSASDLEGLALTWGNSEAAVELLWQMVTRRGLGELLADGVRRAAERIGRGTDAFAIHAGGQELPAHDPRHSADLGLMYRVSPTPGRHTQGGADAADAPPETIALYGLDPQMKERDPLTFAGKAYAASTAWMNTLNASGLCSFGALTMPPEAVPDWLSSVTGWDIDMAECHQIGKRIETMRHLFGLREGWNPLRVEVAARALGRPPLTAGPTAGKTVRVDDRRWAYLQAMGWDVETSVPSLASLAALGLEDLAL